MSQRPLKVVAFNGSPRSRGNTSILLRRALDRLAQDGIETELVQVGGNLVKGCTGCGACGKMRNQQCAFEGDPINEWIAKMVEADGILLGSPTYFSNVTTEMKALIDRAGYVSKANGDMLRRKVGAAVVAVRRAGAIHVFNSINHFFLIGQMVVPGSSYWNVGVGRAAGEVEEDAEGLRTMETLGENMSWVLHALHGREQATATP